jgi:phage terminase large subunit-like protein
MKLSSRPDPLNPKQRETAKQIAGTAPHVLIYGGSRSGKTFLFCYAIAVRAMSAPESRHLIARLHNIDVRQAVLMDTWPAVMKACFPHVTYDTNKTDQFVTFPNGAEVWFGGLDDKERVDKILGKEYATIYVNESSQVAYATIVVLRTRLAQSCVKVNGKPLAIKMFYDLNPVGRAHWTYREFVEKVRPENGQPLTNPASRVSAVINPTDNPRLAQSYLDELSELPERQRKRFMDGAYLAEVPGALWPLDRVEALRVAHRPQLQRIVVAVDPSGSDGTGGDMQGIVVAGLDDQGHAYVLADDSCRMSPAGWARKAINAYHREGADCLVAEMNYGGAMVESTIRVADPNVSFKRVDAARGKHIRAEPVAALYEQGKVHHVGTYPELEEQMGMMTTAGYQGSGSPDRLDALVWALTELCLAPPVAGAAYLELARRAVAANAKTAPEPVKPQYAPGSMEWAREQAALAAEKDAA